MNPDFQTFYKELIQGFQPGFHCVILDLKDLPSHLFQGIVTYNNLPGLLFGFFMNTEISPTLQLTFGKFHYFNFNIISQQLNLFSTISSTREEIHEQEVNLDNLLSFYCGNLFKVPKPRYPSDANSRQRDKESLNSSTQASQRSSLRSLGKVQECSLTQ